MEEELVIEEEAREEAPDQGSSLTDVYAVDISRGRQASSAPPELRDDEALLSLVRSRLLESSKDLLLRSLTDPEGTKDELRVLVHGILAELDLPPQTRARVRDQVLHQVVGMGPELEPYMEDPEVSDIYVVDWETVFVKRSGEKVRTATRFRSYEDALHQAARIAEVIGREVKTEDPILDTRLPNGARLNVIIRPAATKGPVITVRKPPALVKPIDVERLVELGTISPAIRDLYRVLAGSRVNVVFAGSVDVGKTTNIRAYAQFFPPQDRIIVIEDTEELRLQSPAHPHIFSTEASGDVTMHDLTRAALRQGVDRIMYGEVRSAEEIADLRMTWRSGQQGGASSLHARSPQAVLDRLCEGVGLGESREDVFREVTRNLDFVFFLQAFPATGQRFMTGVYEVRSPEAIAQDGGEPLHPLILWRQTGWEGGRAVGRHEVVGRLSRETADTVHRYRSAELVSQGVTLPRELWPEGWEPW